MKLFEITLEYLKRRSDPKETPEGYCPNCWGRQEYGGEYFDVVHSENIDLNNVDEKKGWIQGYAAKHLEGIKLEDKGGVLECKQCKLSYKPS